MQTDIDLAKNSKSIKKTLTIPAWLNEQALEKGINFSQLLQNGWKDVRQRGSHHRLKKDDQVEVIAVHGKDVPIGLLNAILKRTGLK